MMMMMMMMDGGAEWKCFFFSFLFLLFLPRKPLMSFFSKYVSMHVWMYGVMCAAHV
jgi:hypothetical protein